MEQCKQFDAIKDSFCRLSDVARSGNVLLRLDKMAILGLPTDCEARSGYNTLVYRLLNPLLATDSARAVGRTMTAALAYEIVKRWPSIHLTGSSLLRPAPCDLYQGLVYARLHNRCSVCRSSSCLTSHLPRKGSLFAAYDTRVTMHSMDTKNRRHQSDRRVV